MLGLILNLQEGEGSPLKLTLCVTHFSMKLHCRNTSKHTHTRIFTFTSSSRGRTSGEKCQMCCVMKEVCETSVVRPVLKQQKMGSRVGDGRDEDAVVLLMSNEDGWDQEWVLQRDSRSWMIWMWSQRGQADSLDMWGRGTVKKDPEEDLRLDTWAKAERLAGVREGDDMETLDLLRGTAKSTVKAHHRTKPLGSSHVQNK